MTILWNVCEIAKFPFLNTADDTERENENQECKKDHCYRSSKQYHAFKAQKEAGKRMCIVAFF